MEHKWKEFDADLGQEVEYTRSIKRTADGRPEIRLAMLKSTQYIGSSTIHVTQLEVGKGKKSEDTVVDMELYDGQIIVLFKNGSYIAFDMTSVAYWVPQTVVTDNKGAIRMARVRAAKGKKPSKLAVATPITAKKTYGKDD